MSAALLQVRGLVKRFVARRGLFTRAPAIRAADGVDLDLEAGGSLALVGESGSGKTTVGLCILRLLEPDAGTIHFEGQDITSLSGQTLRKLRLRMQIVFQDPVGSLNPRMSVGALLSEPLLVHGLAPAAEIPSQVEQLLRDVELSESTASSMPHELSGGQAQRVAIARALSVRPRLLVCDEPTSALDVSVQARVLALLRRLQRERGLALLFISHDLGVVRHMARQVAVMLCGRIVEQGPVEALFHDPQHPYTRLLLASVPVPGRPRPTGPTVASSGPADTGCAFRLRCAQASERCARPPALQELMPQHRVACHACRV